MSQESEPSETLAYTRILETEIESALREFERPTSGLALSGLSAGLNVSFGALFMAMALTFMGPSQSGFFQQLVLANASAIGFVLVVLGQTELFTAHTTMGILPLLDGRGSVRQLGRLWGVVYGSNLVGCAVFAVLMATVGPAMGIVEPAAVGTLAENLVPFPPQTILLSGVIAGWLMGISAARNTVAQFLFVWLITAGIGFAPFHHCLLGSTEVLAALLLDQGVTAGEYAYFLGWTTLGNVVGGSVFVALLNYGQAVRGGEPKDVDVDAHQE
ncbi:formate/nitrite transporter family protein [Haloarcula nitratireducens]|uniref:Formate/nitrite transporter family protein n=1 Tax=Haloarcula nitratireducens TaxID=2487749 RepID=A0AAW4PAZ0_9EURY|nr:formate/nitrite transporter family protein [Halomicroarcula nitratireducens]MBX0294918.1 formate/nitrite transporter family protein [Halomicroarcula nitratireducens]